MPAVSQAQRHYLQSKSSPLSKDQKSHFKHVVKNAPEKVHQAAKNVIRSKGKKKESKY